MLPICARPPQSVARIRAPVVMGHGLRSPVPLCRSRQTVARNRPMRATSAFRHRAPNPFAGGFTIPWEIFPQIPVIACLCVSAIMPLCKLGGPCAGKRQAASPGYIRLPASPCPPGSRRVRAGWQGQCEPTHAPLCVPYAAEGPSAQKLWRSCASKLAESPLVISRPRLELHDGTAQKTRPGRSDSGPDLEQALQGRQRHVQLAPFGFDDLDQLRWRARVHFGLAVRVHRLQVVHRVLDRFGLGGRLAGILH